MARRYFEPFVPDAANPFDARKAAHLLRRAGFGAPPGQIAAAVGKGLEETIDDLFADAADEEQEFLRLLTAVGFENASIEPTRIYETADAATFLAGSGLDVETFTKEIDGKFMSAFVRATKPGLAEKRAPMPISIAKSADVAETKSCCGPECCA